MFLLVAVLIILAVFSEKVSSKFGVPVLIALIGIGLVAGSDVLNLIYLADADLSKRIADVLLVFILFDAGFRTSRKRLNAVLGPSLILATAGVALTALALGFLIHLITGFDLVRSLLIASIISSTDASAVLMVTRANPLNDRLATTLEAESAANDPMAILLTIMFIDILSGRVAGTFMFALSLVWQFAGGLLVGFVVSLVVVQLFNRLNLDNRGYYYVLIIGTVLLVYGVADLVGANGIIAVFFAGFRLGNSEFVAKRSVSNFMEGLSAFGNMALFLMLGLLAFPGSMLGL